MMPPRIPRSEFRISPDGGVLILALWTLFFLAVLSLAVGGYVGASVELARRFKGDAVTYHLARAGVEKGIMVLAADTNGWDSLDEDWHNEDLFKDVPLGDGYYSVWSLAETEEGGVVTNYGLGDEQGKINVNRATREELVELVEVAGEAETEEAQAIADAIIDWRDEDDVLTGGAEAGYYANLEPSYGCHDGWLDTVYELRLVRGVDRKMFSRLEGCVTVFGKGRVNINTACRKVLTALGRAAGGSDDVSASLAGKIVDFREAENAFESRASVVDSLDEFVALSADERALLGGVVTRYLDVSSGFFFGTATGRGLESAVDGNRIAFIIDRTGRRTLHWHEQ